MTVLDVLTYSAAVIISLSLVYFLLEMFAGIHELRKQGLRLDSQATARYENPFDGDPETFDVYVLIPCLNEEAVIGATVSALSGGARTHVIVIDDGSDDETARIAASAGGKCVTVLSRTLPDARKGKGEALNAGYALMREMVAERGDDPNRVLVLVMDADGRLSDGAFAHVLPLFEDPMVGGAQLAVRIRNRKKNFLTRFQDFQFWSMSAVTQLGRGKTGTVSLGGNGQFTRLAALVGLGSRPWSRSLTEDLDLAISLINHGWVLKTTPNASVDQQAVERFGTLIRQRRRWYQGHMMAGSRLKEIWGNPNLSNMQALELSAYLLVPWIFDLPWSILWHWTLFLFITRISAVFSFANGPAALIVGGLIWYLLTFAPALFTATVYLRRDRDTSVWHCLVLGHSFIVMNYLSFICAWGALYRMMAGRHGWDKTARTEDSEARTAIAA